MLRSRESGSSSRGFLAVLLLGALVYFVALLPAAGSAATYHGDERFYEDAALAMHTTGDLATPRYPDGRPRGNKPLLTYWLQAASFAALGPSLRAARLPSLLAVAATIVLVGLAALRMRRGVEVALLAAAITASDVMLTTLALRGTPDAPLVLFVTAALVGVWLLAEEGHSRTGALLLWTGAGLAAATKGGLGLLLPPFALVFLSARARRRVDYGGAQARHALWAPAVLLGIALGAAGILPLVLGQSGWHAVAHDQLIGRAADSSTAVARQLLRYGTSPLRQLLPWSLLALPGLFLARSGAGRSLAWLALTWTGLLVLVFMLGFSYRARYLAPAHPLVALALADALGPALRSERFGALVRRAARGLTAAVTVLALLLGLALLVRAPDLGVALLLIAALARLPQATDPERRNALRSAFLPLGLAHAAAVVTVFALVRPSLFGPEPRMLLRQASAMGPRPVLAAPPGDEFRSVMHLASQLRLESGGALDPVPLAIAGDLPPDGPLRLPLPAGASGPDVVRWLLHEGPRTPEPRMTARLLASDALGEAAH